MPPDPPHVAPDHAKPGLFRSFAGETANRGLGVLLWPAAIGAALAWTMSREARGAIGDVFSLAQCIAGARAALIGAVLGVLAPLVASRVARSLPASVQGGLPRRDATSESPLEANPLRSFSWFHCADWMRTWLKPAVCAPLFVALASPLEKQQPFVVLGVALIVAGLLAQWGSQLPIAPAETASGSRWQRLVLAVTVLVFLGYTVALSRLAIFNHLAFNTDRADLGYYVSVFRRSSLGDPLGCTLCGGGNHAFDGHFDPILVLLSPLYWLYPQAETLLVLQSLLLGSTVFPLYLLARHWRLSPVVQLVIVASFCVQPSLHGINLFDFHSLALAVPLLVWLLWAFEAGRDKAYWVFLALLLLVREDMGLVAGCVSLALAQARKPGALKTALITVGVSAAYFLMAKAVMGGADPFQQSDSRGYAYYYASLLPQGGGAGALILSVLGSPQKVLEVVLTEGKLLYVLQLLLPVAFLPLLAQRGKVMLLYGFAFTLLASRVFVTSISFHYSALILPFLFVLLTQVLGTWNAVETRRRWVNAAAAAMLGASLVCSWKFGAVLPNTSFHSGFRELIRTPKKKQLALAEFLKDICETLPAGATIAANERQVPHLGRCHGVYRKHQRRLADYVVWVHSSGDTTAEINKEVDSGYLKLVRQEGSWRLFQTAYPDRRVLDE